MEASGNHGVRRGQQRDKPFRDALRMEQAALARGEIVEHPKGSLRWNAQRLLMNGEVPAIKEAADRLDGKVPQAVVGDDDHPPIRLSNLTDDELAQLEQLLARAESSADAGDGADRAGDPPSPAPGVVIPDNGR